MKNFSITYLTVLLLLFLCIDVAALANKVEKRFLEAGLVDVKTIDKTIQVDLVNSDPQKNYFRENYYDGLDKAYLRKEVALELSKAQKILQAKYPHYSLLILDSVRPRSVSKLMYEKMKGTKFEKYVANPEKGSMHNYGIAVDVIIVDGSGQEIDMGFNPFRKSPLEIYWLYAKMKLGFNLTDEQEKNRKILSDTMVSAGFIPLNFEWWHFDGMAKDEARKRFKIIE